MGESDPSCEFHAKAEGVGCEGEGTVDGAVGDEVALYLLRRKREKREKVGWSGGQDQHASRAKRERAGPRRPLEDKE